MKKLTTFAAILSLVVIGTVSLASINLSSLTRNIYRLPFENVVAAKAPPAQTITICKKTIPAGGSGFPFSWANGAGSLAPFTLNDGGCTIKNMTGQDHYNKFTENVPAGWNLTNIVCTHTTTPIKIIGANPNAAFQAGDNTVTMDLNEANVTCTFTNQRARCCGFQMNLSTGQGGAIDPQWKINGLPAYKTPKVASWMALLPAQWIQPLAAPTPAPLVAAGTFKYTINFTVTDCPAGPVRLTGSFAADNSARAYLDGVPIPGASCTGPVCFNIPQAPVSLNGAPPLGPGPHVLQIDVNNLTKSFSGLVVNAKVERHCP